MGDFRSIALSYLSNGLTTIPVGADKQPTINWTKYQTKHITEKEIEMYFKNCHGIAVLTGGLNGIECIDLDMKYDLSGSLNDRYKAVCDPTILSKLWVQATRNKGFHWVYKTNIVEPSQHLARRETTPYEKYATLMDHFNDPKSREIAFNVAAGDKARVLIETRGGEIKDGINYSKGYFLVAPSPGYAKLFGSLNFLEDEERNHLIEKAREFNEYFSKVKNYKRDALNKKHDGDSPFDNFNVNGDPLDLLFIHGWSEVSSSGNYYRLRRPGNPDSKSSALIDMGTKLFNVFTTSTSFEVNKPYTPSDLFIELECNGDTILAYTKLKELGY